MEIIFLGILTAIGFVVLWLKIFGFDRGIRWQVAGDIAITGILLFIGAGTFSGVAMAAVAGLTVSIMFAILSVASPTK